MKKISVVFMALFAMFTVVMIAPAKAEVCVGLCVDNHPVPRHRDGHYYVHPAHRHGHVTWEGRTIQRQPMYHQQGTVWHQVYWYPGVQHRYVQQPPRGYVLAQPPVYQPQPVYQTAPAYAVATAPAPQLAPTPAVQTAPRQVVGPQKGFNEADQAAFDALVMKRASAELPIPAGANNHGLFKTNNAGTPPLPCYVPDGSFRDPKIGLVQRWRKDPNCN